MNTVDDNFKEFLHLRERFQINESAIDRNAQEWQSCTKRLSQLRAEREQLEEKAANMRTEILKWMRGELPE